MVTYVVSLVQLCCGEAGILQTNITGVCGECLQCMDHAGVAPAHGVQVSWSILLRLQVALQGNCPKWALGFVHYPGHGNLSCSGSGSRLLHKGTDSFGHVFCADHLLFYPRLLPGQGQVWAIKNFSDFTSGILHPQLFLSLIFPLSLTHSFFL